MNDLQLKESKELDLIYDVIDDLLRKGDFEKVDKILQEIDVPELSTDNLLGFLTATLYAELPSRKEFFKKVHIELCFRNDYDDTILEGLE